MPPPSAQGSQGTNSPVSGYETAGLDVLPVPAWVAGSDGRCLYFNPAWLKFTGRYPEAELGVGWLGGVHPDDLSTQMESARKAISKNEPYECEYRLRRADGSYRWVLERANPIILPSGNFNGYVGICLDTTERRESDIARRLLEEQTLLAHLATGDMVWAWDARSSKVINSPAFASIFGDLPGPLPASIAWVKQRLHPEDTTRILDSFQRTISNRVRNVSTQHRFRRRDNSYSYLDHRIAIERDAKGNLLRIIGSISDITLQKRAEAEANRSNGILNTVSDMIVVSDRNGTVTFSNRAARKLLGWPLSGKVGTKNLTQILPPWASKVLFQEAIPNAIAKEMWAGQTAILGKSGLEIPVAHILLAHPGPDGRPEYFSSILKDLSTSQKDQRVRAEWNNHYEAAIRASGQLLFDWNSRTQTISYGGNPERFLGFSKDQMEGGLQRLRQLIHPEDLPEFDAEIAQVIERHEPFYHRFRIYRKSGEMRFIEARGYFFTDAQGQTGRMVGFMADVTEHQRALMDLARAQEQLEARVKERTTELAQTYTLIEQHVIHQKAIADLGQRALSGEELESLFEEANGLIRSFLAVDICAVLEISPNGLELTFRHASGWPQDVGQVSIPTGTNSQAGYTLLHSDPVIVEDTAKETRFLLSRVIRKLGVRSSACVPISTKAGHYGVLWPMAFHTRSYSEYDMHLLLSVANVLGAAIDRHRSEQRIRAAQQQAEAANRAKSEFLSRMSHELRTPLNAILGFSDLLQLDSPNPNQMESIEHITKAGRHLQALINDVLDIARIDVGRLTLMMEPVQVGALLDQSISLIQPSAQRLGVKTSIAPDSKLDLHIHTDRQRCQQVLLNLLSNAVKFNRPGGAVSITCLKAGHKRLRISITDTGPGIAPEHLSRLFVPFDRLGAETRGIEGTGVGLAIARRLVEALQGQIGFESTPEVGSTFWIELPTCNAPAQDPEFHAAIDGSDIPAPNAATPRATILYVEDQDMNVRLVERLLQHRPNYKLIAAMQGGLALELAREHLPDLILLDLNLPDITGDEVFSRLKADPRLAHIPVVLVSAHPMSERIQALLDAGATGLLSKPYKIPELFSALDKALNPMHPMHLMGPRDSQPPL